MNLKNRKQLNESWLLFSIKCFELWTFIINLIFLTFFVYLILENAKNP